jgi:hypothetical protein
MAIDERSRHALHLRLAELLGDQEAATLMEHLPPVGWADVATKRDLDASQAATRRDIENLRLGIRAEMNADFVALQRFLVVWVTTMNVALAGVVFAVVKLA